MTCDSCKYSHPYGTRLYCFRVNSSPRVEPDSNCEHWTPVTNESGWVTDPTLPDEYQPVLVWMPGQNPFPQVREGYIVDKGKCWYIPALGERWPLEEIQSWRLMPKPPKEV